MMTFEEEKQFIENRLKPMIDRGKFVGCKLYIFGHSFATQYLQNRLKEEGIDVVAFLDNDSRKWGNRSGAAEIIDPRSFSAENDAKVLIYSGHDEEMTKQLIELYPEMSDRILHIPFKRTSYDFFWTDDRYNEAIEELRYGKEIYDRLKNPGEFMFLSPTTSIGDTFLWELTLQQYVKKENMRDYQLIVCGKGSLETTGFFNERKVTRISFKEMVRIMHYVFLMGEKDTESLVINPWYPPFRRLGHMALVTGKNWGETYPRYTFQLGNKYKYEFPDIHTDAENRRRIEKKLSDMGVSRGKGVLLSPYAQSMDALPVLFWEKLIEGLKEREYSVYTNVAGEEKPIEGTEPLSMPIRECADHMEYMGTFIALCSGLCDIVGHADCRQIVLHREVCKFMGTQTFGPVTNDLTFKDISPNVIQILYDEKDYNNTLTDILDIIDRGI